ncbi:cytochrome c biogenesis CcdA family protein [Calditerricola yamamurae]
MERKRPEVSRLQADVTLVLAFGAGFLSFLSPCCLPLYPSYLSYITGISGAQIREDLALFRRGAILHTLFFMLGFSVIFFALGLSATALGSLFSRYQDLIRQLGGLLIVTMGLFLLGVLPLKWLYREKRWEPARRSAGYVGSFLVGISFAAGWTPCIGPILTAILTLSAANPAKGVPLITAYIAGFALPFFIMSFFLGRLRILARISEPLMKVGGAVMIVMGILLYTNQLSRITIWLIDLYGGFTGF